MPTRTIRRPLRLGVAALLLSALAVLAPIAPAEAHDRLVSSDPESGASLEDSPEEIGLTFSANVQDIGGSVDLLDGDGEAVDVGSPETEGTTVTTPIEDELPAGDYEVRWRVVSSDGHPISGVVDFTVEEGPEETTGSPSSETSPDGSDASESPAESSPGTTDEADEATTSDEESGTVPVALLGVGAVVVVLGAGAVMLRSRRRSDD